MELFNLGQSGDFSIYLPPVKNLSIDICKLERRQICLHSNLNGPLVIVQVFEEGEEQRSLVFIDNALAIIS